MPIFCYNTGPMAFEVTHVRFARDISDQLKITDQIAYFSGSIYPDSRYSTGVSRKATHKGDCCSDPFKPGLTDFEKGWATHLLYDELSGQRQRALVPESLSEHTQQSEWWIRLTSIKMVEDLHSYDELGADVEVVGSLELHTAPVGEDLKLVRRYYDIVRSLYKNKPSFKGYLKFFSDFGLEPEVADAVVAEATKLLLDAEKVERINGIYDEVLAEVKSKGTSL